MVSSCRHSRQESRVIWSGDIRAMSRHIRSERRVIDGTCLAFRQIILTSDVGKIDPPPSDSKHVEQGGLKQKPSRRCSCIIVRIPHNINAPLPKPTQQVVYYIPALQYTPEMHMPRCQNQPNNYVYANGWVAYTSEMHMSLYQNQPNN